MTEADWCLSVPGCAGGVVRTPGTRCVNARRETGRQETESRSQNPRDRPPGQTFRTMSPVSCLLSPVSCFLSRVSYLLFPVSCFLSSGFWLLDSVFCLLDRDSPLPLQQVGRRSGSSGTAGDRSPHQACQRQEPEQDEEGPAESMQQIGWHALQDGATRQHAES